MKIFVFSCSFLFTAVFLEIQKFFYEKLKLPKNKMAKFGFSAEQSCKPVARMPSPPTKRFVPVDRDDFSINKPVISFKKINDQISWVPRHFIDLGSQCLMQMDAHNSSEAYSD